MWALSALRKHVDTQNMEVSAGTGQDSVLCLIAEIVRTGCRSLATNDTLKPYFTRRAELAVHQGYPLLGTRVVSDPECWYRIVNKLH